MRTFPVAIAFCLAGFLALPPASQAANKSPEDLTVILDFKGPRSQNSIREMEQEARLILNSFGVRLGWALLGQQPHANYTSVAIVTFRGSCEFNPWLSQPLDSGSYAFTQLTDGQVEPFAEVNCNRVASAVQDAISGRGYAGAEQMFGRALGRVLAHELVHILTRSVLHASEGVTGPALSPRELTEPHLPTLHPPNGKITVGETAGE
jgi:hypothetical protein